MRGEMIMMTRRFERLNIKFDKNKRYYRDKKGRNKYSESPSKSESRRSEDKRPEERKRNQKQYYKAEGPFPKKNEENEDDTNKCVQCKKTGHF